MKRDLENRCQSVVNDLLEALIWIQKEKKIHSHIEAGLKAFERYEREYDREHQESPSLSKDDFSRYLKASSGDYNV